MVAERTDGVEIGQAGGEEEIVVGASAAVHPVGRELTEVARGLLPRGERGFLRRTALLRWPIETSGAWLAETVSGMGHGGGSVKAGEERFAVRDAHNADVELGLGKVGHDVDRGTAAADITHVDEDITHVDEDIAHVDEYAGVFGGTLGGREEKFGEREDRVATGAWDLRGMGGATAARGGDAARAPAGLHDVSRRPRQLEHERERVTRGGFDEERGLPCEPVYSPFETRISQPSAEAPGVCSRAWSVARRTTSPPLMSATPGPRGD